MKFIAPFRVLWLFLVLVAPSKQLYLPAISLDECSQKPYIPVSNVIKYVVTTLICLCACFLRMTRKPNDLEGHTLSRFGAGGKMHAIWSYSYDKDVSLYVSSFQRTRCLYKVAVLTRCTEPVMKYTPHSPVFWWHPPSYPPVTLTRDSLAEITI